MTSTDRPTRARTRARVLLADHRRAATALAVGLGLSGIVLAGPVTAAGPPALIDDFLTPGSASVTATVVGTASATEGGGSASTFGGTRSLTLTVTDPATPTGALTFSARGTGSATITAPGPTGATVKLDYPSGAGGAADLTDAGAATAIRTRIDAATPGSTLAVTVASNGARNPGSTATKAIPTVSTGRSADMIIPFSELATGAGCSGPADLTTARDVTVVITLSGTGTGTGAAGPPAVTLGRIDTVDVSGGTLPASHHATPPNRAAIPIALLLIVLLFLLVQNRLDRGDPKLAHAPVHGDDDLEFR